MHEMFKRQRDISHRFLYPCILVTQYNLIGRVDDCCELSVTDIRGHPQFPFAIKTKVRWSKNVLEERDCPDQIFLAAGDPVFCQHLNLGLHMEYYLRQFPTAHYLFTEEPKTNKNAVKNLIAKFSGRLGKVCWSQQEFKDLKDEDDILGK